MQLYYIGDRYSQVTAKSGLRYVQCLYIQAYIGVFYISYCCKSPHVTESVGATENLQTKHFIHKYHNHTIVQLN